MRPELLIPDGEIMPSLMVGMLSLVGEAATMPSAEEIVAWCPLERAIVYDWAVREHLHASDNLTRRRPRPSLLGAHGA